MANRLNINFSVPELPPPPENWNVVQYGHGLYYTLEVALAAAAERRYSGALAHLHFFQGYDQGVIGGVNASSKYVTEVGIGKPDGTVTDTTHQGGVVLSAFTTWVLFSATLLGDAQNSNFMIYARVVTGIGTGALTGITPVLVSETSSADHRSGFLGCVVIANCKRALNPSSFWYSASLSRDISRILDLIRLAFLDSGRSDCFPALIPACCIKMLPDSSRYLASVDREEEARELLGRIRKHSASPEEIGREYLDIITLAEESQRSSPVLFARMALGKGGKQHPNSGRRAWLCVWLQIMASWTGITVGASTAFAACSPVLLPQVGYSAIKQNGLTGGINTIVDRLGRRVCLMAGSAILVNVNLVAGAVYEGSLHNPEKASQYASGAITMLLSSNIGYAATCGTVAFLLPTEIFLSHLQTQTVTVERHKASHTYFFFAGLNLLWIPIILSLSPETRNRSLESIEALFSTLNPFYWKMEQAYKLHGDVLAEHGRHRIE
ncbi:MFS sugar transporter, putative [Talaromyces stipitatus ATCC 10500]|uniref:MFS sugar transporter, putative n=1 Tax=Talaromyces stipitatus (strain ATCC 10500 / CBS 375.48 / QM 6759 / NRRL 1006) TaxID=441959 RepID=B8ML61_TALSN|nr:MFS sugar transporter, putative [Talaromyces stipitatus ATCC 10500]EED14976.1 MFS sugar transporter, putative [Talaromyces stipitatus ATCC 10500]